VIEFGRIEPIPQSDAPVFTKGKTQKTRNRDPAILIDAKFFEGLKDQSYSLIDADRLSSGPAGYPEKHVRIKIGFQVEIRRAFVRRRIGIIRVAHQLSVFVGCIPRSV